MDRWFDKGAFGITGEPTATLGVSGRNILRGPGQVTVDAALAKHTRTGRIDTELRLEVVSVFNRRAFINRANTIGSANAGTISGLMPVTAMRQLHLAAKARL